MTTEGRTRVMVVEDAPAFQEVLILVLTLEPYIDIVYIADSGEEALKVFPKVSPDLVLLDFRLPGIDGVETAKRMRTLRPDVKIAIVTAYADEVTKKVAKEGQNMDVIPKSSFSLERVQKLLGRTA